MPALRLQPLDRDRDADPKNTGRRTVAVMAAVVVLGAGWLVTQPGRDTSGQTRPPSTTATSTPATPNAEAVTHHDLAGLLLPISSAAGPHDLRDGRASGFARTDQGAAFAAVHLLVRTFPFVGSAVFEPTIAEQVLGPDAPALARLTSEAYEPAARAAKVQGGAALGSEGGWVAGYRLDPPDPPSSLNTQSVAVLLRQSDGPDGAGFVEYRVRLVWQDGDWRLLAPAWGDWRTAAHAMTTADRARYRSYDQDDESPTAAPA
jgi:hypothetical protein